MKKLTKKDCIYLAVIALLVAAIVVVGTLWGVEKKREGEDVFAGYYDRKCASYAVQNANLAKGQIVFIGDSITDLYPLDAYYADLDRATYNRGIGGDTSKGVAQRLQVSVYDLEPSAVVLMIGINDIDGGVPAETTVNNYRSIVEGIRIALPDAALYCMSILPQNEVLETYSSLKVSETTGKIKSMNEKIREIASDNACGYVDLFSAVNDGNDRLIRSYSDDGLHLNVNGFAVWTSVLHPLLERK